MSSVREEQEVTLDAYRMGFEAGYFYGRIHAIKDEPYDDRTPLTKAAEKVGNIIKEE